jgi:hypothetical protein
MTRDSTFSAEMLSRSWPGWRLELAHRSGPLLGRHQGVDLFFGLLDGGFGHFVREAGEVREDLVPVGPLRAHQCTVRATAARYSSSDGGLAVGTVLAVM